MRFAQIYGRGLTRYFDEDHCIKYGDEEHLLWSRYCLVKHFTYYKIGEIFQSTVDVGVRMVIKGQDYYVKNNIVFIGEIPLFYQNEGKFYYNQNYPLKYGLKKLYLRLSDGNKKIIPMDDLEPLFYTELPKFKFKTIKEMKEGYKAIGGQFMRDNHSLFNWY